MRKYLVYLLPFILYFFPRVSSGDTFFFALPAGHPFKGDSFSAGLDMRVELVFGEKVDVVGEFSQNDLVWYQAKKGRVLFYLPEPFIVKNSVWKKSDNKGNLPIGYEIVDKDNAIPIFYKPDDLVKLPVHYSAEGYKDRELFLRHAAAKAFMRMIDDAENNGIIIRIISAFRDSNYQAYLYKSAIDRYGLYQSVVAKPGHSEHQLGTTCDLTTDELGYGLTRDFESTFAYRWLMDNSYRYSISGSYPKYKERITGYIYEPWHFRYWGKDRWKGYIDKMDLFFTR